MNANGPEPLTAPKEHAAIAYGQSYLGWKGWDEEHFGKVWSLETLYFEAELKRANFDLERRIEILEIGFGNASFLAWVKNRGWNAVGTEINSFLVEMATRRGLNAIHSDSFNTLKEGS